MPGYEHPQYIIEIDGEFLQDYLNRKTGGREFNGLLPPLGMVDEYDQELAVRLVRGLNQWTPVLICADDMDLSCSVVSAYVEEFPEGVAWTFFGWGVHGDKPIPAPGLLFERDEYARFVADFVQLAGPVASAGYRRYPGQRF